MKLSITVDDATLAAAEELTGLTQRSPMLNAAISASRRVSSSQRLISGYASMACVNTPGAGMQPSC